MANSPTYAETVSGARIDLANPDPELIQVSDIAWSLSRQARYAGHTMCRIPYTVAQHTVMVSRYVEEALTPETALNEVLLKHIDARAAENVNENAKWSKFKERAKLCTLDARRAHAFHGLLHDFAEAYLVDLPTPVKRLPGIYEAYKKHELAFDALIYRRFGLGYGPMENSDQILHPIDWEFGLMVVAWADAFALLVEAYHLMPSRGRGWNIPIDTPPLKVLYGFRWSVDNLVAYDELLARFKELQPSSLEG